MKDLKKAKVRGLGVIAISSMMLASLEASAAIVTQNIGSLTRMWAHATYGGGDVFFVGATGAGPCQAFWLRATDDGFKSLYAVVLTARATGRPVLVYAQDNELWGGSGTPTCRIEAVDFAD